MLGGERKRGRERKGRGRKGLKEGRGRKGSGVCILWSVGVKKDTSTAYQVPTHISAGQSSAVTEMAAQCC